MIEREEHGDERERPHRRAQPAAMVGGSRGPAHQQRNRHRGRGRHQRRQEHDDRQTGERTVRHGAQESQQRYPIVEKAAELADAAARGHARSLITSGDARQAVMPMIPPTAMITKTVVHRIQSARLPSAAVQYGFVTPSTCTGIP